MNNKRTRQVILVTMTVLLNLILAAKADYRVLHNFTGTANDGSTPLLGKLALSGSTFYGMTSRGGSYNNGIVFKMNTDGGEFQVLHSFVSASTDGQEPFGSLIQSGSTLYGMATSQDSSYGGTVFKLNLDGTGFQVLHNFAVNDGMWPQDSLIQTGLTLYGMCTYGGSASGWNGKGTIFKINTDGTNFQKLHTFTGNTNDGYGPHGSLIESDVVLYGMAEGGSNNYGSVFRINHDGTGFELLHNFNGGINDGGYPAMNTMVLSGSTFYGTTWGGGSSGNGAIFKMNTDGTGFALLHSFAGNDGHSSHNGLTFSGSTLYGITAAGGSSSLGTIFQIKTDGTGYQTLHNFNGTNGTEPMSDLLLSGSTLYGMTYSGGSSNLGVIYALDVPVTCVEQPSSDLNGDCKVDFQDFAIIANHWLDCGLEPAWACNQ